MQELDQAALTAQLNTLLKAYSAAATDAGIVSPTMVESGTAPIAMSGDLINNLNSLGSLSNLTSMTQIPTTWSGVVNMLPKTGMFSMESMIWSTVWTFVVLWLLWYSKERAKARLRAKAFHKEAKKFIKEYRKEELEHEKEMKRIMSDSIPDLPAALQIPQNITRPDMSNLLKNSSTIAPTTAPQNTPPPQPLYP